MMQFLADNILSPAAFFLLGVFLILWGIRRWTTRLRFGIGLVALGFVAASVPSAVPIPIALTNAALLKLPGGLITIPIARVGVNTPGDAPVTWWTANTNGNCAGIGLVADVGSCNNASDGYAFVTNYPASGADVREWGVIFDNSTDNTADLTAALTWAALGNHIILPAATKSANFATAISVSLATTSTSMSMTGAGADLSMLEYTGSSGVGITITYDGLATSTHLRDFSFLTNHAGGATGLELAQVGSITNPAQAALTDITNAVFRGADGYYQTDYWTTQVDVTYVSNINFTNDVFVGAATPNGTGVNLAGGGSTSKIGVVYNFIGITANYLEYAISYGPYIQGVTVSGGSNFVANINGVYVPAGGTSQDQLTIIGAQFGYNTTSINDRTGIANSQYVGNLFVLGVSDCGVCLVSGNQFTIASNSFLGVNGSNNGTGVSISATSTIGSGNIANNVLNNLDYGIFLNTGTQGIRVPNTNSIYSVTNPITNDGTNNNITIDVVEFGADPTDTNDSTTAFQTAINTACTSTDQSAYVPIGTYKISSTLTLGNGSSSAASTCQGVYLKGTSNPTTSPVFGFQGTAGPDLKWAGSGSPVIAVDGPLTGWGLQNLYIDCQSAASATGIQVTSAQWGDNKNLSVVNCQNGISSSVVSTKPSGVTNVDSLHNTWHNISINTPNIANSIGFKLNGVSGIGNTDYNDLENITFSGSSPSGLVDLDFAGSDSNTARNIHMFNCSTNDTAVLFDYSVNAAWPAATMIYGIDPSGTCSGGHTFANNSSPSGAAPNLIYGLYASNGAVPIALANLVFADGAWINYTPTLSCGSGTLSSAAANGYYSQVGNTVNISIIADITTNGSCAGSLIATLPTNAPANTSITYTLNGVSTAGAGGYGFINPNTSTTTVVGELAGGTYPGANNTSFTMTGTYQTNN